MKSNGDAQKDSRQLEQEVDQQRREIDETIHALEDKFSSREIYNQVADYLRNNSGEFAENLGNNLKANPVAALLTGVGLTWMIAGSRNPPQAVEQEQPARSEQLKEKAGGIKQRVAEARGRLSSRKEQARQQAGGAGQQWRERAGNAQAGLSESAGNARQNMESFVRDQPMALGAIGVALGALVGAALPRSRSEEELLGNIGERTRSKASALAEQGRQRASEIGESVGGEAEKQLHQQAQQSSSTSAQGPGAAPTP